MPDGAEAEEGRDHGQAQPVVLRHEVLDSGEHAVLGPALARRRAGVGQAVGAQAGIAGEEPAAASRGGVAAPSGISSGAK